MVMRHLTVGRSRWTWRSRPGRCAFIEPLREVVGHYSSALLRPPPIDYGNVHVCVCVKEVNTAFPAWCARARGLSQLEEQWCLVLEILR